MRRSAGALGQSLLESHEIAAQPGPTMLESPSRAFTNDVGACVKLMAATPGLTDGDCLERMLASRRAARAEQHFRRLGQFAFQHQPQTRGCAILAKRKQARG